jgi:hypothetical protein
MDKQQIIKDWSLYYINYLILNSDLKNAGITSKHQLLNHFIKYGFNENRPIQIDSIKENSKQFILTIDMISENI